MGEGGLLCNELLINKLFYVAIVLLSLSQFLLRMFNKLKAAMPHIYSESNSHALIVNAVFKYLRQFLGTSFGVTTLSTCCKIK